MKIFAKTPYENIIGFIDAVIDSEELMKWLIDMEALPDNLRSHHLAQMKTQMRHNREPERFIEIVEEINRPKILSAINLVIKDVNESGMRTKKYLKHHDNESFSILISLMSTT